ncbi:MAG: CBS domain-containing protein [Euryarchaeota archaeon]|nr:CBS domain-containing protein [Euryarchaeota archaeon]
MHIKDIMTRRVVVIDKDQNIHDALKFMRKHRISRLPVVNTNMENVKELVGIITEKDIASRLGSSRYGNLAPSHFHVSTVMNTDFITVESTKHIAYAAKLMVSEKIGGLPVVDDGEIVGIVTKTDFMDVCVGKPFQKIQVKDRMTRDLINVAPQDRLVHARRLIIDEEIGRLPVVEEKELAGIITAKDIAESMMSFRKVVPDKYKSARIRNLIVEDVMTQNVKTIDEDASIAQVSQTMLEHGFSGIPVLGSEKNLAGIITKTDLLDLIVEFEEVS